jgi:hypothetical protein
MDQNVQSELAVVSNGNSKVIQNDFLPFFGVPNNESRLDTDGNAGLWSIWRDKRLNPTSK